MSGPERGVCSHPEAPVRHSYPLAVSDAGMGTALSLMTRTLPYALARFGVLVGASVLLTLWVLVTIAGAVFLAERVPLLAYIWVFIGFLVPGYAWKLFIRYGLYLLKAGHIAVLTELITVGQVQGHAGEPGGMFAHGKRVVTERFGEVNAMFALDALIKGVVLTFNRTLDWVASILPIPGMASLTNLVNLVLRATTSYVDETIFSYSLARGDDNRFRSARDGLVYYAQNAEVVLKTGAYIVVLDIILSAAAWVLCLLPAGLLAYLLPPGGTGQLAIIALAVLVGFNVRAAFLHPFFLIMVMIKFHLTVRGQAIRPEWDTQLQNVSSGFEQLVRQAGEAFTSSSRPAQEGVPVRVTSA
jgi:hypothetical protein